MNKKRIAILGSTGSVGTQALDVAAGHPDRLHVECLAAGRNVDLLVEQVQRWQPSVVSMGTEQDAAELQRRLEPGATRVVWGADGLREIASHPSVDTVLNAVVGAAGLAVTYEAVTAGKQVALANKESLVMAGELIMAAARRHEADVLPVDSEPNALHQCLRGERISNVRRLILTASGGPFRTWPRERLSEVTPKEALNHPTWLMGQRITIDSATLMNKGFEIIEAYWLFGVPLEAIEVVVHPQSAVHSLVEFSDGSLVAQVGPTDMRIPIQYALSYPERWSSVVEHLDVPTSSPWEFEPSEGERFVALDLARQALRAGGTAPAVLNAADEVAVAAFLQQELRFDQITAVVADVLEEVAVSTADSIESILEADATARRAARARVVK
jgi:1-deoxy-D-xylulose-5-phosphate reductoisomerase